MEPEGNEAHYSEIAVSAAQHRPHADEVPAALHDGQLLFDKFDLPATGRSSTPCRAPLNTPRNDWAYAEIAKRHGEAFIVLVGHI